MVRLISIVKPTRCTIFEFTEYHSTSFRRASRPSSGVQDCTHSIRYMSRRLGDLLACGHEMEFSCPLASSQLTCMTYTWSCVYSLELLIRTERPSETRRVIFNEFENCASSWFYNRNISRCTVKRKTKMVRLVTEIMEIWSLQLLAKFWLGLFIFHGLHLVVSLW
jgi:hypothetical protein